MGVRSKCFFGWPTCAPSMRYTYGTRFMVATPANLCGEESPAYPVRGRPMYAHIRISMTFVTLLPAWLLVSSASSSVVSHHPWHPCFRTWWFRDCILIRNTSWLPVRNNGNIIANLAASIICLLATSSVWPSLLNSEHAGLHVRGFRCIAHVSLRQLFFSTSLCPNAPRAC